MKIYTNKYRDHWISPYTMIDYLFFWTDWSKCSRYKGIWPDDKKFHEHPDWVTRWHDRLSPISSVIMKVLDVIHPKIDYIKIDRWDTWNMDSTLSPIILPMLKQLKATKHGSPLVDDSDVPDELKSTSAPAKENDWDTDDNHHKRWEWVLDEMIFAFEHLIDDSWEDEFREGKIDFIWTPVDNEGNEVEKGNHTAYRMDHGPNDTYKCDYDGMKLVQERIQRGTTLFGKYYSALWD